MEPVADASASCDEGVPLGAGGGVAAAAPSEALGDREERGAAALEPGDAASPAASELVSFRPTAQKNVLDDWLHRGPSLYDVPLYLYARYFERMRKPNRSASMAGFQRRFGASFMFDEHYELSSHYVQIRRRMPHRVRHIGPNCPRAAANSGEDNAMYKSLFSP